MKLDGGEKGPPGHVGGRRGGDALARKYPRDKKAEKDNFLWSSVACSAVVVVHKILKEWLQRLLQRLVPSQRHLDAAFCV